MNEAERIMIYELKKEKTNHLLHLFLSFMTGGIWIVAWAVIANENAAKNKKLRNRLR